MMHGRQRWLWVSGVLAAFVRLHSWLLLVTPTLMVVTFATFMAGCGGGKPIPPPPVGDTKVTVVMSSTANSQLSLFGMTISSITLTSQNGKTVTLTPGELPSEFMHLNGNIEPLLTVAIPQDVYTAASATIGAADLACVTLNPSTGGLVISIFAYGSTPNGNVTVSLPSPITVTGDSMGLLLDLLVSQSATFSCGNTGQPFAIKPTFNLTPVAFSSQASNAAIGKAAGLDGKILSIDPATNSFTLAIPEGWVDTRPIAVISMGSTVFQGVSGFSALAAGTFVNVDGAIQLDGSLVASRVAVQDPSALNVARGPLLYLNAVVSQPNFFPRQQQTESRDTVVPAGANFDISNAKFQIFGQLANLEHLPFVPVFTAANMVAGQEVSISYTEPLPHCCGNPIATAQTLTLMPQTINGTVVTSSQAGGFVVYTVSLAAYDLFPTLAVQPGQTTVLTRPNQVEVYVDNNTQLLNKHLLAPGSTLRFYGLVFNDNGTLRMVCTQVNDGVL